MGKKEIINLYDIDPETAYPYNLVNELFGHKVETGTTSNISLTGVISALNEALTAKERTILLYRFMEGLSLKETGDKLGISSTRVRDVQMKALRKLRNPIWHRRFFSMIYDDAEATFNIPKDSLQLSEKCTSLEFENDKLRKENEKLKSYLSKISSAVYPFLKEIDKTELNI